MNIFNSFQELAIANGAPVNTMAVFNRSMTAEKFKRIQTTEPSKLTDDEIAFVIQDTKKDYDNDLRRGESSSEGRLYQRILQEQKRRNTQGNNNPSAAKMQTAPKYQAQAPQTAQAPQSQIKAADPAMQQVLEAAAVGQFPSNKQQLMQVLGAARASGNKMSDNLRNQIIAGTKQALQTAQP